MIERTFSVDRLLLNFLLLCKNMVLILEFSSRITTSKLLTHFVSLVVNIIGFTFND